jgi:hypothetical protein
MTFEEYKSLGHIRINLGDWRISTYDEWFLKHRGDIRRIELAVPSFRMGLQFVAGTERVLTSTDATRACTRSSMVDAPFDIPPIEMHCSGTNTGNMIRPSRGSETSCNRWRARFSSQVGHSPRLSNRSHVRVAPTSLVAARDHDDVRRELIIRYLVMQCQSGLFETKADVRLGITRGRKIIQGEISMQ